MKRFLVLVCLSIPLSLLVNGAAVGLPSTGSEVGIGHARFDQVLTLVDHARLSAHPSVLQPVSRATDYVVTG